MKQIILTGMTPSAGSLTIGNYIGAMKPMVQLQNNNKDKLLYLFVSDLHSLTNPAVNLHNIDKRAFICTYIAAGIDLNITKLFYQSDIAGHSQLGWVLACNTTYGELSRMTQFKDKSVRLNKMGNGTETIPTGLLIYPTLMAADILLYDTNLVPVGKDQKQHVELTRDIATRFNNKYGNTFVIPDVYMTEDNPEIMDLKDPTKKMSKSATDKNASIFLFDKPAEVEKKIKSALTDCENKVKYDKIKQPGISNLITIYSCISGMKIKAIEKKYAKVENYGVFKKDLIVIVNEWLSDFQKKYAKAYKDFNKIALKVKANAAFCNKIANKKMQEVYNKIGII